MDGAGRVQEPGGQADELKQPDRPDWLEPPDELSERFERLHEATFKAAGDYGIRWKEPEGRFVQALLGGMEMLNASSLRAERAFAMAASDARRVAEAELLKVREVALAIEGAKHQARASIEMSRVEHQVELRKIVAETMPGLVAEMQKLVVIREQSWNRQRARAGIRTAGLWVLGLFLAGFALCLWMQWSDSALGARCRSNLVSVEGRTYCLVSAPPPHEGGTNAKE